MNRDQIAARLKGRVSQQLGITDDEITMDSQIVEDLGADSLDCVEIVMLAEEEFTIEIDDEQADAARTFGQLCDLVAKEIARERKRAA